MSQALMDQWKKEDQAGNRFDIERGQGVRAAFEASSDLNSSDVAESLRLAKSLGIPENVILEQRNWAAQEEKARTVEKNPLLAEWAEQDRKNAVFVRDDPDAMLDLFEDMQAERRDEANRKRAWEERYGSIRQRYEGPLEQIPLLLQEGLREVGYGAGGFVAGAARFLGNGTFVDSEGNLRPYRSDLLDSFGERWEKDLLERRKTDPARLQAETELGGYVQDVIRQIPQLGTQILATAGTGGLGGMAFMGSQIAGGQYLDLRERGVEPDKAFTRGGLANAAFQAPLEQISLGRFMNIFKATGGRAIAKRALEGTGTEALTEYLQAYPESATELWALLQEDEGAREWLDQFVAALPETHREGLYSAAVAAPFGLLGGLGRAAYDRSRARETEAFVDREKALHAKVEATQVKKLSPESTESALRAGGMLGNVMLPADKVLELHQSGREILAPLGLREQDVIDAAQMGQDIEMPRSRLHAMLDQPSFDAVAGFMRPAADALTLEEASDVETRIKEDAESLGAVYAEYQAEQNAIDAEVERVRSEIESSLKGVPGVASQIESDTALEEAARGERMTPERAADLYSNLLLHWAQRRRERTGTPVAESLRRFNVQGLVRDSRGRLKTPQEMEESLARTEREAADREFLGYIWGRLNVDSLAKDYPDARKELTAIYGRRLFETRKKKKDGGYIVKKGTDGIDELAQELENRGLIEAGGGADALIERLKQGRLFFQGGNELASRFADMPMIEADSSRWFGAGKAIELSGKSETSEQRKKLRTAVKQWAKENFSKDTVIANADTGWQVQVTPKGIENSLSHGFDETLARSVPFIPQIIEGGVHVDSIRKTPQLLSHIFANKIRLDGQDYVVGFVLREDVNGNRFYDHELTEIINPDWLAPGHPSNEGPSEEGSSGHRTNRGDVMNILRERLGVNDGTGRILFQFIDPARVQATPGVQDVVPVLRRIFHMNTMELDDSKAIVTVPREIGMSGPLTDIYQHDALYELYPELRDIRYEVVPEDRLPGNLAGYSPKNGIIYITTDSEVTPSVIAHEVQHAIQDVDERFDFGLSEEASQEVYSQVEQELKDKLPIERARALAARIQYLSQAHEIQAFDTQNRFELTAEERAKYAPNNPSTYYQTAYHGTPHRFDAFSLNAIGTGEGNQVHGWGLYFAKERETSERYKTGLGVNITLDGKSFYDGVRGRLESSTGNRIADETLLAFNGNIDEAMAELRDDVDYGVPEAKEALEVLQGIKADNRLQVEERGQLFEVDIPENDVLLDEGKSYFKQSDKVRDALAKAGLGSLYNETYKYFKETFGDAAAKELDEVFEPISRGVIIGTVGPDTLRKKYGEDALDDEITAAIKSELNILIDNLWDPNGKNNAFHNGRNIYKYFSSRDKTDRAASESLNAAGIKGITYEGGQDGRAFVVFDDKAIKVLDTYYQQAKRVPRASISPVSDGYLIQLYKNADLSSLLHETGHFFLMEMEQDIRADIADESLRADYATLMNWLGATEGEPLTREQHEQFARGFEAYLREGKAPSKTLESPFARFKKWLLRIYRQARQLNVELTDDVRGVFDRLLATDAEVNTSAVENGLTDLSVRELDALGVRGADRIAISNLMKAAADTAAEKLQQDRDRRRQQQLRIWAKEAREEVDTMPVYIARRDIQKLGVDAETVQREYGDQAQRLMRSLPGSLRREGGADPELFALEHGYDDAGSMFAAILDAPRKSEHIRQVIAEKQAAWDGTFDAADYLLETDEAARQMELVGRYIRESMGKTVAGQDITPTQENFQDFGHNARRVAGQEAFQRLVSQKLATMPAGKAVQTGAFRLAMRRAITEERRAIVRMDWEAAFDANVKARLNMEFARQSTELRRRIDSLRDNVKRFVGMAKADPNARFIVGAMAQHYGLGRLDPRLITEDRNNPVTVLNTWTQQAETDGYPLFVNAGLLSGEDTGWRDLSLADLEAVADALNQIMTVERNRRKLLTAQGKADLDSVVDEIAATVANFRDAPVVKTVERENPAVKALKNIHAIHTKVEALCLALDGDRPGPVWEHVYRPITKAEDDQSKRFRIARDELRKLFFTYSRKELTQMRIKKEYVASIGEKLTKENRLAVALNLGNAANIERVRSGHGWTDAQILDVVRPLTRRDWEFVQSVWDYLDTFREASFRLQEEVTGMRPKAVEAQPLQVTTADGETLELRGGYYPIKYNAEKGSKAFEREQKAMDQELFGGRNYGGAQTRQGHLKERAAGGTGEPLLFELSVVTDHVFNVIHDLSYRKAVLDVAKVLRHDKVKKAISGAVGSEMYNQLKPWLMDVANERQEPMHAVHRMANWARASTSIMQMGWKITTMLAQALGITQTAEVLGYRDTAAGVKKVFGTHNVRQLLGYGVKKVYSNPLRLPEILEETFARSPMMADRIRSYDREIRDMTKKLMPSSGLFGWVDKVRDSAFIPMGVFQMGVDLPTWWGGYTKGLREFNGDETRAAEYADSVVRMTQGSGSTKDLARVQRGGPLLRLVTMFYSYFNTFYNLAARRFTSLRKDHSPAAVFRAANTALLLWFVPSVLGELAAGRGPDDDEEWEDWIGMQILQYPFQAVVGIRELASGIFGEYGYQITPAESAPTSLVKWFKAVNKALEEEDAEKLARPTAEAVGYLFGLPMKQPIITVGNVWDYVTGNDPDFYVRDLFLVKPKERR